MRTRHLGTRLVDATTLALLATIVQTVVITLTLLVFVFQFRSQERAIKESSYQNLLGRYNDLMMSGSREDDLLFARLLSENKDTGPNDLSTIRRLLLSYGIIEEAYELNKKGWINRESWEQWNTWLKALSKHPYFVMLRTATTGMYDKDSGRRFNVVRLRWGFVQGKVILAECFESKQTS